MFIVRAQIEAKLRAAFNPIHLDVVDESYRHNVPAGSESHFKVVLVTDHFQGVRFLARHREVYSLLQEEMKGGVHAIALHTYTQGEWQELQDKMLPSPPCRGVGDANRA